MLVPPVDSVLSNVLAAQSTEPVPIEAAMLGRLYPAVVPDAISLTLVPVIVTEIAELRAIDDTAVVDKPMRQGDGGTIVADAPRI
jgi:hypothetical protein